MEKNHAKFSSQFGYIMVAAGAAIGLGNIWRFPYVAYKNGGAAFILVYILVVALIGKVGVEIETSIGRYGKSNAITSYSKINSKYKFVGWIGIIFTFMLDMYYVVVSGYVLKYAMCFLLGINFGQDKVLFYNNHISNPVSPIIYTAIIILIVTFFLISGITHKVEQVSKYIMPALLILLIGCGIWALFSSPNAINGLKYYIIPDFSQFTLKSFSDVCVQVMFSIGTGWTLYVTLGANISNDENIKKDAIWICVCDTMIAILAGFVIIPSIVGSGSQMEAGPSLIFIVMAEIFEKLPAGRIFGFLFFLTLIFAVISSLFTFIEIPTVCVQEKFKISHKKATIITSLTIFIFSILCAWSQGNGILSFIKIPWLNLQGISYLCINDWVDSFSSYILMPIGNIAVSLFCVKAWGFNAYEKELTMNGRDGKLGGLNKIIIAVVIPIFSIIVLLNVLGFIN